MKLMLTKPLKWETVSLSRAGSKPTQLILYNLKVITFSYCCQKYFPIMNKMFEMIVKRESFKLFEFVTFIELHLFVDCCPYIHFRMLQKYCRQEEILAVHSRPNDSTCG